MKQMIIILAILTVIGAAGVCRAAESAGSDRDSEREQRSLQFIADRTRPELSRLVAEALESIESHPQHHLERGLRDAICRELVRYDQGIYGKKPAHASRVLLVEKELTLVKPLWRKVWADDPTVDNGMAMFYKIWRADTMDEKRTLLAHWDQDWQRVAFWTQNTWLQNPQHHIHRFSESLVGLAVVSGHVVAGEGAWVPDLGSHAFETDTPDQFWHEDVDFYAASAYAGGLPYTLDGFAAADSQKYRKFWRWWLLEALPESIANYHKGYIGMSEDWQQR